MMLNGEAEKRWGTVLLPIVGAGPMTDGLAGGQAGLWCLAAESAGDCWCLVLGNGACASPCAWQGSSLPCSLLPHRGPPLLGEWGCWAVPGGETEAHHTAWGQGVLALSPSVSSEELKVYAGAMPGCWAMCVCVCLCL